MAQFATDRVGTELSLLRQRATELARQRNEPMTTCHLLAAAAMQPGQLRELLQGQQLTAERILAAAQHACEPRNNSCERAFSKAVALSHRMGSSEPGANHLVMAILSDSSSSGRRIVERLNVDAVRLRSQAWNLGVEWHSHRTALAQPSQRHQTRQAIETKGSLPRRIRSSERVGATIPLFPPRAEPEPPNRKRPVGKAQSLPIMPERPQKPLSKSTATRQPARPIPVVPTLVNVDQAAGTSGPTDSDRKPTSDGPVSAKKARKPLERFELDPKRFPVLSQFGKNLTLEAAAQRLDDVLGRENETSRTLDILAKRHGNSPCLVGPSGVGKTSIVRGIALRIVQQDVTSELDDRIIIEIAVGELLAGTGVRGALAQRIGALRNEVRRAAGKVVIFFDEIHLLFTGDAADESGGELKLALSRGEFPCIGATTAEDYRRSIEADPALARRFTAVEIEEPSAEDAFLVLEASARKLEQHHGVRYSEDALALSVGWSKRYLPGRMLPEKAISIADLAGARARRRKQADVNSEHIADIVASMANIPIERLLETDAERMLALERLIGERVVGHDSEIRRICNVLRRNAAGLGSDRPIGTFLLLGPTGVGKTETAKALAHALFHSESAMTRLDMAEYSEAHAVAKLIGAPPGYVGHDAGGQLTESVRKRPYQVVLLDEIEKAHNDVLQSFLGVFDEGRLSDGKGRTIDFRNTIILMTSNLGAEHTQARTKRRVGFASQIPDAPSDIHAPVIAAARARLSPELYNRIDELLVYGALTRDEVKRIAQRLVHRLGHSLRDRGVELILGEGTLEHLLAQGGYDLYLGARPMKRTIARLIEAPLAERLLSGEVVPGSRISIEVENEALTIRVAPHSRVASSSAMSSLTHAQPRH